MGHQVVINFVGLCIHVHKTNFAELPCEHRVILLANPEAEEIQGHHIDPHQPEVTFFPSVPQFDAAGFVPRGPRSFRLDGVRMRIMNGSETLARRETFRRVPQLTRPGRELPAPDLDVILAGKRPAAAYFDIDHGAVSACRSTPSGALGTSLVIDTGSEVPLLEISSLTSNLIGIVPLAVPKPRLHFTNVAERGEDDDFDYLLNYRILKSIPSDLEPPRPDVEALGYCAPDVQLDFGPPCSNSNYP